MKALLMHLDHDFNAEQQTPAHEETLMRDLELNTLIAAMSGEDGFLLAIAKQAIFQGLQPDAETILYRQDILKDCLRRSALVRELYGFAVEAIAGKRRHYISSITRYPAGTLYEAIEAMSFFAVILKKLREFSDQHIGDFGSKGLCNLLTMLRREFSDEYFGEIEAHLKGLKFKNGVLMSVELGTNHQGANYVLRKPEDDGPNWLMRLLGKGPPSYSFRLADRDEVGARILGEMRDRGINLAANALAQSADHIASFFTMLRTELAFYIGCLNLRDKLAAKSASIAIPEPHPIGTRVHHFTGLRDASLVLTMQGAVVDNAVNADGKDLVVVTGANQGGKSTLLRAIGLAQLMMQAGMFVTADSFSAELCANVFTHYKREEDATMTSGKLDEELTRMDAIISAISPNSMMLFNESFASTNEREGSEIARQIVSALLERQIKVVFVTHLYDFAHGLFERQRSDSLFLRAERKDDGTRTFKLIQGEPLDTSYGEDLYMKVFTSEGGEPGWL